MARRKNEGEEELLKALPKSLRIFSEIVREAQREKKREKERSRGRKSEWGSLAWLEETGEEEDE
jgi:hypothetical protein